MTDFELFQFVAAHTWIGTFIFVLITTEEAPPTFEWLMKKFGIWGLFPSIVLIMSGAMGPLLLFLSLHNL